MIRPYDLLLDAASGWRPLETSGVAVEEGPLRLQPLEATRPPLADPAGILAGHTLPRGVAVWGDEVFMADPSRHRILRWRPCCGPAVPIPTIGGHGAAPRQLDTPLGLAISHREDLVVADSGNRRLVLFTLPGLALRRVLGPYETRGQCGDAPEPEAGAEPWRPVDVAAGPDNTLYVADANGSIWRLDAQGRPDPCYPGRLPNGAVPWRVLVDRKHRAYVIVDGVEGIVVLDRYGHPTSPLDSAGAVRAWLPASRLELEGDQVLLTPADRQACHREPQATDMLVDNAGRLRLEDAADGPPLLRRPPTATFAGDGVYRSEPLDSRRLGNPWHRLVLEVAAPERTGVRLFTFTSDVLRPDLDAGGLLDEPPRPGPWQAAPDNAEEWLIQSQPGRYLYLALAMKGTGDRTPSVERIYVYAQRQSSLRYLPAVYQADETSRHVLDRLLSLFDTVLGEVESEIEDFPLRLDVGGAPADFLPWLASWFDLGLEQSWTDAQRRAFVKNVVRLYRWRGTIRGLRLLLQLHASLAEPMPRIVEHHRTSGQPALQTWLGPTPDGDAGHHFSVLLPGHTLETPDQRAVIQRLIDANKPAHTRYSLRAVVAGARLGSAAACGSALGLDSLLASHSPWRLAGPTDHESVLGGRTLLPAAPAPRSVGVHLGQTRLGASPRGCRTCPACEEPTGDSES